MAYYSQQQQQHEQQQQEEQAAMRSVEADGAERDDDERDDDDDDDDDDEDCTVLDDAALSSASPSASAAASSVAAYTLMSSPAVSHCVPPYTNIIVHTLDDRVVLEWRPLFSSAMTAGSSSTNSSTSSNVFAEATRGAQDAAGRSAPAGATPSAGGGGAAHAERSRFLVLDRSTDAIRESEDESFVRHVNTDVKATVFGVIGVVRLLCGRYLLLARSATMVGTFMDTPVYRITAMSVCALIRANWDAPTLGRRDAEVLKNMRAVFKQGVYCAVQSPYLQHSLARIAVVREGEKRYPFWMLADNRFFWNRRLAQPLVDASAHRWIMPMMCGFFRSFDASVLGRSVRVTLISRRSRYRAGVRYLCRGANRDGHVANFVETEQLVQVGAASVSSFVVLRGSVPLFWHQETVERSLAYTPPVILDGSEAENSTVFARHFDDLLKYYQRVQCIDLLGRESSASKEQPLSLAFQAHAEGELPTNTVTYTHFDYHKQASALGHNGVQQLLLPLAESALDQLGLTVVRDGAVRATQGGAVRVNCLDCLDRTGVVQSVFARAALRRQVALLVADAPEPPAQMLLWADNADAVSVQYAGTGALKGEVTRTGVRSVLGALADGLFSLQRFVKNNFTDSVKQVALDLVSGRLDMAPTLEHAWQLSPLLSRPDQQLVLAGAAHVRVKLEARIVSTLLDGWLVVDAEGRSVVLLLGSHACFLVEVVRVGSPPMFGTIHDIALTLVHNVLIKRHATGTAMARSRSALLGIELLMERHPVEHVPGATPSTGEAAAAPSSPPATAETGALGKFAPALDAPATPTTPTDTVDFVRQARPLRVFSVRRGVTLWTTEASLRAATSPAMAAGAQPEYESSQFFAPDSVVLSDERAGGSLVQREYLLEIVSTMVNAVSQAFSAARNADDLARRDLVLSKLQIARDRLSSASAATGGSASIAAAAATATRAVRNSGGAAAAAVAVAAAASAPAPPAAATPVSPSSSPSVGVGGGPSIKRSLLRMLRGLLS